MAEGYLNRLIHYKKWILKHERRPRYRNIRISVERNGTLRLITSMSEKRDYIEAFLHKNEDWIFGRIAKSEKLTQKHSLQIGLVGEEYFFLGEPRKLCIEPSSEDVAVRGGRLLIGNPRWSCRKRVLKIRDYYHKEAKKIFPEILEIRAQEMGLAPQKLIFRGNVSRWGSCNSRGTISLNWKMMAAPLNTIDYVIVHELAHLKYPNHGKKFWDLVATYVPDYKTHVVWLREHHYDLDFLTEIPSLHSCEWK